MLEERVKCSENKKKLKKKRDSRWCKLQGSHTITFLQNKRWLIISENRWENGETDQKPKPIKNSKLKKAITKIKKFMDIKQEIR